MVGRKSSCTVQQRQPLLSSTKRFSTSSSGQKPQLRIRSPSKPTLPNSFTITAKRWPLLVNRWRRTVVLPAPRNPVMTVTGSRFAMTNYSRTTPETFTGGDTTLRVHTIGRATKSPLLGEIDHCIGEISTLNLCIRKTTLHQHCVG